MTRATSHQQQRRARQGGARTELRIDELVLHGASPAEAADTAAALETALARLAARPPRFLAPGHADHIASPAQPQGPAETGEAVAATVWSGVRQAGGR